jgi:hypothetical protein
MILHYHLHLVVPVSIKGEAREEEPPGLDNVEHDINNNIEQTAAGDEQKDDFTTTEKIETEDGLSDTSRKIEVPNHRVLSFIFLVKF